MVSESIYRVLSLKGLVYGSVAPADALCSYQKAHHEEDAVPVEYRSRRFRVAAWEPRVFGVLVTSVLHIASAKPKLASTKSTHLLIYELWTWPPSPLARPAVYVGDKI